MSQFGKPLPNVVTESTAIEIQRKEGSARSWLVVGTAATASGGVVLAGNIMKLTNSGLIQTVGTEDPQSVFGVALYQAVSGQPTTCIRGRVRAFWDGINSGGTITPGLELQLSYTYSGWVTGGNASGAWTAIGIYEPFVGGGNLGAANSGTLIPLELY